MGHTALLLILLVFYELRFEDGEELFDDLHGIYLLVLFNQLANLFHIDIFELSDLALLILNVRLAQVKIDEIESFLHLRLTLLVIVSLMQIFLALLLRLLEVLLLFLLGCLLVFPRVIG